MTHTEEIVLEAEGLDVGASRRIVCPVCRGGDSHDQTMSITRRADGVLFNCHRASCGARGFTGTAAWTMCAAPHAARVLKPYEGELLALSMKDMDFFARRYELVLTPTNPFVSANEYDEYVLPISWLGHERGYNVRQPWPGAPRKGVKSEPKSSVHMHSDKPVQAAYSQLRLGTTRHERVILVEDQLSAYKTSLVEGVDACVALLGTHLNLERVREIVELRPSEVIIALDADATKLAFDHAREFGLAFPRVRVSILAKDLKDTKLSDIPLALGL